jgi:putative transposase
MQAVTVISKRRACGLMGVSRSLLDYVPRVNPSDQVLTAKIISLAQERRRFGYRRIHARLRREGVPVNHKRDYRLYRLSDLAVRKRKRRKGIMVQRVPLELPAQRNEVWSMDFVMDALFNGRRIKILAIVDDCTRELVDLVVDFGISGRYVTRILDQAARFRGYPKAIRTEQGPEFTSHVMD